jgi:hypothetical protein
MKVFKLVLSEKIGQFSIDTDHEKFIEANDRDSAYDKSLELASNFFNKYSNISGIPDKDMIFWSVGDCVFALWIKSLEEIEVI